MINTYNRVILICPGGAMTAGPEAIHQLVADLNRLGQSAAISYFPFEKRYETVLPYQKYKAPVVPYEDCPGDLIVFPEIVTPLALKVKNAKAAIWWMSVNNFTCERYGYIWRDKLRYFKYFLKGLRPWGGVRSLKHLIHFAQSYYALDFLKKNGIEGQLLSDPIPVYTSQDYLDRLSPTLTSANRKNVILYNPHKGAKITANLMRAYPDTEFKPLQGYNREQLAEIFLKSKIYMDFGHHPGKDRLPREAAIHGCAVITGLNGSAANDLDVNIPKRFKLNDKDPAFVENFGKLAHEVFENFEDQFRQFQPYRETIAKEQIIFDRQIMNCFGIYA